MGAQKHSGCWEISPLNKLQYSKQFYHFPKAESLNMLFQAFDSSAERASYAPLVFSKEKQVAEGGQLWATVSCFGTGFKKVRSLQSLLFFSYSLHFDENKKNPFLITINVNPPLSCNFPHHSEYNKAIIMILMRLMMRSLLNLTKGLVCEPAATLTTILYYGNLLPRDLNLERFVRREYLHQENHFFHFLITMLRCVW
ncbi:hypothetical protein VNO77_06335 [Canavalia gladiata]|uniref:Uncharacterized protein n=1 Tax=Canavalia gladiata TaxID=3824 RepID=A0AAN9MC10_CANGL